MNNAAVWIPIAISVLALAPSIYVFVKTWQKSSFDKSDIVFQNAMALIEANKKQAEENEKQANHFREQLNTANNTIRELTTKLHAANRRADKLAEDLSDANIELISLRAQIDSMSKQVNGESTDGN